MEVEVLDEVFPATPIVIGRLRGGLPGPSVVLNGHLDTVPIPHAPARVEDGAVVGRGSADMKGALACAAETARVLKQSGPFPGELVIVAIGLHEAPGRTGRGPRPGSCASTASAADFAVVCELSGDTFVAAHMGQATVEITIERAGMVTHELKTAPGTPHPILAAGKVIQAIEARNAELAPVEHPLGRSGDVLRRRGPRRRLLQPLPHELPARRHAPLGAGEHARGGRGRVPRAARADRGGDRLLDRARPPARARRVLDRPRAPALGRPARGLRGRHGHGAAARRDQAGRRRGGLPGRCGDPDRLPRPGRQRRPRRRRGRARSPSSCARRGST